ncbi:hypothetical protein CRENPOLYSF1_190117 [Crenothrix polyspora]|uniref:Uncharacterized protein n=1 Tax=Crenothrix polyspora TaxID=360316 RepID=A0A1R4H5E8_9GAMM|nr:hypothetical protein CRENPOLYSF1_190117 [Crenothrix polyspora]
MYNLVPAQTFGKYSTALSHAGLTLSLILCNGNVLEENQYNHLLLSKPNDALP